MDSIEIEIEPEDVRDIEMVIQKLKNNSSPGGNRIIQVWRKRIN